jgi:hypothetical protein
MLVTYCTNAKSELSGLKQERKDLFLQSYTVPFLLKTIQPCNERVSVTSLGQTVGNARGADELRREETLLLA